MNTNLQPIDDRMLVLAAESEDTYGKSKIIIPDVAKKEMTYGEIVELGTDEELQELFKVGDIIFFAKYSGEDLEYNGRKYKVLSRSDIMVKQRENKPVSGGVV